MRVGPSPRGRPSPPGHGGAGRSCGCLPVTARRHPLDAPASRGVAAPARSSPPSRARPADGPRLVPDSAIGGDDIRAGIAQLIVPGNIVIHEWRSPTWLPPRPRRRGLARGCRGRNRSAAPRLRRGGAASATPSCCPARSRHGRWSGRGRSPLAVAAVCCSARNELAASFVTRVSSRAAGPSAANHPWLVSGRRYHERIGAWRSLASRVLWEHEIVGSNPAAPTIPTARLGTMRCEMGDKTPKRPPKPKKPKKPTA